MAKKFYAKQLNNEYFDYEVYYSEDDAIVEQVWCGGNRDFKELNANLVKPIKDMLNELPYYKDNFENKLDCITYYLGYDKKYTDVEIKAFSDLADRFYTCKRYEENELICRALKIIYGKEFTTGTIRGCCQSDWMDYIMPLEIKSKIDYIEAVLFATGVEYAITEEKIESAANFDEVDTYSIYVVDYYYDKDIKEDIAEQIACNIDELVVLNIESSYTEVHYNYREF